MDESRKSELWKAPPTPIFQWTNYERQYPNQTKDPCTNNNKQRKI